MQHSPLALFLSGWALQAGGKVTPRAAAMKKDLEKEAEDKLKACTGSILEKASLVSFGYKTD